MPANQRERLQILKIITVIVVMFRYAADVKEQFSIASSLPSPHSHHCPPHLRQCFLTSTHMPPLTLKSSQLHCCDHLQPCNASPYLSTRAQWCPGGSLNKQQMDPSTHLWTPPSWRPVMRRPLATKLKVTLFLQTSTRRHHFQHHSHHHCCPNPHSRATRWRPPKATYPRHATGYRTA